MSEEFHKEIVFAILLSERKNIADQLKPISEYLSLQAYIADVKFIDRKDSCLLCEENQKKLFNNAVATILLGVKSNFTQVKKFLEDLKLNFISICKSKYNLKSNCPTLEKQLEYESEIRTNLLNHVNEMLSSSEIVKYYDLLVSMDSNRWIPIDVVVSRLNNEITISKDEFISELKLDTVYFEIDETETFMRKIEEYKCLSHLKNVVVIYEMTSGSKNAKDFQYTLGLDDVEINQFSSETKSCLMTVNDANKAQQIVIRSQDHSVQFNAKFLIPQFELASDSKPTIPDNLEQLLTVARGLLLSSGCSSIKPTRRFSPNELNYKFQDNFEIPSQNFIHDIINQTNYYFSDTNIMKDLYLYKLIELSKESWVNLDTIFGFRKIQKFENITKDIFVYSMCFSDAVQIDRDGTKLRRRLPLPKWSDDIFNRLLFIWDLRNRIEYSDELYKILTCKLRLKVRHCRLVNANRYLPSYVRHIGRTFAPLRGDDKPVGEKELVGVIEFKDVEAMVNSTKPIVTYFKGIKYKYLNSAEIKIALSETERNDKKYEFKAPYYLENTDVDLPDFQIGSLLDPRIQEIRMQDKNKKEHYHNKEEFNYKQHYNRNQHYLNQNGKLKEYNNSRPFKQSNINIGDYINSNQESKQMKRNQWRENRRNKVKYTKSDKVIKEDGEKNNDIKENITTNNNNEFKKQKPFFNKGTNKNKKENKPIKCVEVTEEFKNKEDIKDEVKENKTEEKKNINVNKNEGENTVIETNNNEDIKDEVKEEQNNKNEVVYNDEETLKETNNNEDIKDEVKENKNEDKESEKVGKNGSQDKHDNIKDNIKYKFSEVIKNNIEECKELDVEKNKSKIEIEEVNENKVNFEKQKTMADCFKNTKILMSNIVKNGDNKENLMNKKNDDILTNIEN